MTDLQDDASPEHGDQQQPEIVLRMDDDDADMIEDILADGGVKPEVIRRE